MRLSGLGAALPQRDEAPSLVLVDLRSFHVAVLWTEKPSVVRSYLPRRCARWPSAALPSVVTCSKYVLIYVFPVELSKLADRSC